MSSINILNYKDIDVNEIVFSNPEKLKGGSYMSTPKYNSQPIYIQTPRLTNKVLTKTEQRCSIELELDNTHLNFYEFITNVDDFNIVEIQKNSKNWFKQEFPLDIVEEFYKSPVKMARNKKAPSLKIKIPLSKGSIDCGIFNNSNQLINYSQIKKNFKVLTVLHFYGLRFLKQQVICEWIPIQIKVFDENVSPENNYLIDDTLISDNENNLTDDEAEDDEAEDEDDEAEDEDDDAEEYERNQNLSNVDHSINTSNGEDLETNEDSIESNESTESNKESNESNESNKDSNESNESNEESNEPIDDLSNLLEIDTNTLLDLKEIEISALSNPEIQVFDENNLDKNNSEESNININNENSNINANENPNPDTNAKENNENELKNTIKEKNERIEFLENKIRELYKYLSNN